ncbi:MAG: TRAP transporter small permease [Emcibacteraceae bacterium]|jgi:C4-dicarboxylate transporter, DctQ subunit|uniref:TRAP transporter small permease n=1 Tax=Pseudemcibacter sp. TaxID=2943293 RepID=UPI0023125341|nr:TRAP transporter small permease [Kordiimonadaceae bacterium]MDA7568916.1 TRAP transporter small permease [Emcibacteraceae bacterium]MDA9180240.1 TRAP transporter small permease [Emcibacteraceae bacterium]MDA9553956.1 TRAP transporter small permease [Emcibacteraceae bacterium]MDC1090502.1 TRAP transporter small permease [Emcibacteraceae bacterium]
MENAKNFLDKVYKFERAVAIFAFSVMTLIIIADVIIRKIAGVGIAGAMRIAVYAMIVTALISFGLASHKGRHLRPKFADQLLPKSWEFQIISIQESLHALFSLVFAIVSIGVVYETYLLEETSRMLRIAIWPMQSVIPFAFIVGFVRHSLYALYPKIRPGDNSDMTNPEGLSK